MGSAGSVRARDVVPSYAVFAGMMSLGGYLVEEWTDYGGLLGLIIGTALVVAGFGAGVVFSVRWWQVTHRYQSPSIVAETVTEPA